MKIVKIILTCPRCGNNTWVKREDEEVMFECLACGEFSYPEDMCSKTEDLINK